MGLQDREYQSKVSFAQARNTLIMLISVNLIIFVILIFLNAVFYLQFGKVEADQFFSNKVLPWFVLPADLSELASKPWTILTHMFVHFDVWHVIGNMLWLWFFGTILQDLTGNDKLFPVYFYGGLFGALAFILSFNFLPTLAPEANRAVAMGASAGVMGIAAAVTTIAPGYRILPMLNGGIPVWIITVLYLVIDLATIPDSNAGGHIAHLAGALAGFLFVVSFRRGLDWGAWINRFFDWFTNLFNPERPKKGKDIKQELFYKSVNKPYKKTPNITEQRVNEILDKISQKGLESLTDEEKELLKRASRE